MSNQQALARIGVDSRAPIRAWLHHHRQAAQASYQKLLQSPASNFLTILVIGVALTLPCLGISIATTVQGQIEQLDSPPQLSLLLDGNATFEEAARIREQVMLKPGIAEVELVDRDHALAEFTAATGLQDLVERMSSNPLPHSVLVYSKANVRTAGLEQLQIDLGAITGVSQVILDSRWLKRLNAFTDLLRKTASVLFLVMALGVVLTLGNTLRLGIEARRDEIVVIKLIGGGNDFARRPFLYTGLFTGALGGVMGSLLSGLALIALNAPVSRLFELYDQVPVVFSLGPSDLLMLTLMGAGLGLISAWYSAQLYLTRIQPK